MSSWSMDRWLAVLGLGGTITGFVLSVWLWLKARQEAIPRYKARTLELIAPLNQEYYFRWAIHFIATPAHGDPPPEANGAGQGLEHSRGGSQMDSPLLQFDRYSSSDSV